MLSYSLAEAEFRPAGQIWVTFCPLQPPVQKKDRCGADRACTDSLQYLIQLSTRLAAILPDAQVYTNMSIYHTCTHTCPGMYTHTYVHRSTHTYPHLSFQAEGGLIAGPGTPLTQ